MLYGTRFLRKETSNAGSNDGVHTTTQHRSMVDDQRLSESQRVGTHCGYGSFVVASLSRRLGWRERSG